MGLVSSLFHDVIITVITRELDRIAGITLFYFVLTYGTETIGLSCIYRNLLISTLFAKLIWSRFNLFCSCNFRRFQFFLSLSFYNCFKRLCRCKSCYYYHVKFYRCKNAELKGFRVRVMEFWFRFMIFLMVSIYNFSLFISFSFLCFLF